MQVTGLKFRYVATVLLVGIALTASVALSFRLYGRLGIVVGLGFALSLVAAGVTAVLIARIDRAMAALITGAERIGQGLHSEPLRPSGVPEMRALEDALERMRETLTRTTITRDYLETVLNSMSDAVLVTSADGHVRTVNRAAERLLGLDGQHLVGREF